MVFQVLNKLKWKGGLDVCIITIRHRGAPDDEKKIHGSEVTKVKKSYFCYTNNKGEETVIPLHRILRMEKEGKVLWKKSQKG